MNGNIETAVEGYTHCDDCGRRSYDTERVELDGESLELCEDCR